MLLVINNVSDKKGWSGWVAKIGNLTTTFKAVGKNYLNCREYFSNALLPKALEVSFIMKSRKRNSFWVSFFFKKAKKPQLIGMDIWVVFQVHH